MLPRVILHNAVSADGRMDGFAADLGLYYDLAARFNADVILSGSETMLAAYASIEPTPEDMSAFEPPRPGPEDARPLLVVVDLRIADYLVDVPASPGLDYRSALVLAMKKEKAAFKLYSDLAAGADDENVRATFLALAQEEARHKLRFELEYDDLLAEN